MRYHYEKPNFFSKMYGVVYECNHPVYSKCTLYKIGDRGLAVIQQHYDSKMKITWWENIDPWLTDELYLHPNFKEFFEKRSSKVDKNGFYPTVTIRQIMWALKMKPLPKQRWETVFDRQLI